MVDRLHVIVVKPWRINLEIIWCVFNSKVFIKL